MKLPWPKEKFIPVKGCVIYFEAFSFLSSATKTQFDLNLVESKHFPLYHLARKIYACGKSRKKRICAKCKTSHALSAGFFFSFRKTVISENLYFISAFYEVIWTALERLIPKIRNTLNDFENWSSHVMVPSPLSHFPFNYIVSESNFWPAVTSKIFFNSKTVLYIKVR